jgi:AcrR family transcriptional regulator
VTTRSGTAHTSNKAAKKAGNRSTSRAARGSLSRERLVEGALDIVAQTGLDGLSMRALGAHLGVDHTAVYRYFRTKDELLDALADAVVGGGGPHPETGDPRQRLRAMMANLRHTLLAHPALAPVVVRRPPQGEATWQGTEHALACLGEAGLDEVSTAAVYQALLNYTLGHALLEAPYALMSAEQVQAQRAQSRASFAVLPAERYPNVTAIAPHFYIDMDTQYLYGLDLLLRAVPVAE